MNSLQLHRQLVQELRMMRVNGSKWQLKNLALMCQSLAFSRDSHLATVALGMPLRGKRSGLVQRVSRFLQNPNVEPSRSYRAVRGAVLANWQQREINLVMDRTDIEDRWSILSVGVAYQKRMLPLAWLVLPFGGTSAEHQLSLLRQVKPHLPSVEQTRIHFFGDSEFRSVELQQEMQDYQWHWQVGLKGDTLFRFANDQPWRALTTLSLQPGQRRYVQHIILTKKHSFAPVNLIAAWSANQDHPKFWALDQAANKEAWRRGRKRFWIEPTFRDWKSYGFDLERTQLDDPQRLDRLILAVSLTTLWLIHIGDWLTQHGHRSFLEAPHKRDFSLFRLGRDHLQRAATVGVRIPIGFTVGAMTP